MCIHGDDGDDDDDDGGDLLGDVGDLLGDGGDLLGDGSDLHGDGDDLHNHNHHHHVQHNNCFQIKFLSDPGDLVRSLCPYVRHSLTKTPFVDLTDVTLANEDTNSILTDNANRAIPGNVAMHVTQPGGQHWNQCK